MDPIPCFECKEGVYERIFQDEAWRGRVIKDIPMLRCTECSHTIIGDEGLGVIEDFKSKSIDFCGECGKEMVWNVPRLGPRGGFVHKESRKLECQKTE